MTDITLTFGKYNGKRLSQVPPEYIQWLSEQPTICGKRDIPQAARLFIESHPTVVLHEGKECLSCRLPIHGEAIPVRETYHGRTVTKYMHRQCAEQEAMED